MLDPATGLPMSETQRDAAYRGQLILDPAHAASAWRAPSTVTFSVNPSVSFPVTYREVVPFVDIDDPIVPVVPVVPVDPVDPGPVVTPPGPKPVSGGPVAPAVNGRVTADLPRTGADEFTTVRLPVAALVAIMVGTVAVAESRRRRRQRPAPR